MGRTIVVTGTGTGVGKTFVTAVLATHLREEGFRVVALKPFASGSREDASLLRAATGNALSIEEINPWFYNRPLAPLAASIEGEDAPPRLESVVKWVQAFEVRADFILLEGVGGLYSPLGQDYDLTDISRELNAPLIVAARNELGVMHQINVLLRAAAADRLTVSASFLNPMSARNEAIKSNMALLQRKYPERRFVAVPFAASETPPAQRIWAVVKKIKKALAGLERSDSFSAHSRKRLDPEETG